MDEIRVSKFDELGDLHKDIHEAIQEASQRRSLPVAAFIGVLEMVKMDLLTQD